MRITQRKHSISRAWILIIHRHTKQVLREEWSGLVVAVRKGRRRNHEEWSQSVFAATPAAREKRLRCEIRNVRSERFFLGSSKGGRRYGDERGEGHDDVDGGLKGNECRMIQAWVRNRGEGRGWSLPTNREKKNERT